MGGFFGITSKCDCMMEVFFGVDYHSHLGTRRGGMAAYDKEIGLQRKIHNIENSPFRTKFEKIFEGADEIYYVTRDVYTQGCMKKRNRAMVEASDYGIAYCVKEPSGTSQTVKMAQEKGIDIVNIATKWNI